MFRKTISLVSFLLRNKHAAAYCSVLSDSSRVHSGEVEYVSTEKTKKVGKTRSKKTTKKESVLDDKETLDIIKHIQQVNPDICPKHLRHVCNTDKASALSLIDRETAVNYVSLIKNDLLKNTCFVAEMSPGFGILTTELLKAGVPLIHLYETNQELYPVLSVICDNYPGRLDLRQFNLAKISQMFYVDKITDANKVEEALRDIEHKNWEDETCMQVVGTISSEKFFGQLVKSLLYRNCLMAHGRPVFYIGILPSIWHKYTCGNTNLRMYTGIKVLFQTMFDYQLLGTLDRKAFLPWTRKKKTVQNTNLKMDHEVIYVIRLEPKVDLYSQLLQKDWVVFSYFARHHLQKPSSRVIPELEKWIPGCGIRLIAKDYTIFTQFGELIPAQIVELFKEFKSWPEYKESYFLTSMKDSLTIRRRPIVGMRYLLVVGIVFMCNYVTRSQDLVYPNDEETSHVSGNNNTVIAERLPVFIPGRCPKDMLLFPGDSANDSWVCDCRPRFLYFPLNDSCHEAYKRGPCPFGNYVVLPENEAVPRCVTNPCTDDGVVPYNGTCYPLRTVGGPCAPDGIIGVNETTFQLECVPIDVAPFMIIDSPPKKCPPGTRRSTLKDCRKIQG